MKDTFLCTFTIALLLLSCKLFANNANEYWQQSTDYKIEVSLDDKMHELRGFATIEYTNNSPEVLQEIVFLLYPNAYSTDKTAFAEQQIENDSETFYFSDESDRGGIDGFEFRVDGESANFLLDESNPDIGYLKLNAPITSGTSITISTPFRVKIPYNFSRLGRDGESYQLTQWYPKPAVYDQNGWHPYPYLTQGEFYYEYGSYDVSITVPENYVVAATGELQTESEIAFLKQRVKQTQAIDDFSELAINFNSNYFPYSADKTKTIRYLQENVHDFAWFADKRFHVLDGEVHLADGRTVNTYAFFTDKNAHLWKDGVKYINQSIEFFSEQVGNYPFGWTKASTLIMKTDTWTSIIREKAFLLERFQKL